jgi:hypothetical protein
MSDFGGAAMMIGSVSTEDSQDPQLSRQFGNAKNTPDTASPQILQKDRPSLVPQQAVCDVSRFPVASNIV